MGDSPPGATAQANLDHQKQQLDPNTSIKTEYMSFPPPVQHSPLNTTTERGYVHHICIEETFINNLIIILVNLFFFFSPNTFRAVGWLKTSYTNNNVHNHQCKMDSQNSPSFSPTYASCHSHHQDFDRASQESFSSIPDPVDPTTITKTFKTGHKATAKANLASRSKTPNSKNRRRRSKGQNKNSEGEEMRLILMFMYFFNK